MLLASQILICFSTQARLMDASVGLSFHICGVSRVPCEFMNSCMFCVQVMVFMHVHVGSFFTFMPCFSCAHVMVSWVFMSCAHAMHEGFHARMPCMGFSCAHNMCSFKHVHSMPCHVFIIMFWQVLCSWQCLFLSFVQGFRKHRWWEQPSSSSDPK